MNYLYLLIFISFSVHAFTPAGTDNLNTVDGGIDSDSGIYGPSYSEQVSLMQELVDSNSGISEVVEIGQTVNGRMLTGVLFRRLAPLNSSKLTIITGATHGNEYLNIVDRLAESLLDHTSDPLRKYLSRGGEVLFIPVLNPDGYDERQRGNARGVDLNRDWPNPGNRHREPRQPETRQFMNWVDNYITQNNLRMNMAMDYHCCVEGMLLLPWGWKRGLYMNSENQQRSKKYEDMMRNHFPRPGEIGTPPDLLYSATGTTLDYWYEKYDAVSFTYEGRRTSEKNLLSNHVNWWSEMLETL